MFNINQTNHEREQNPNGQICLVFTEQAMFPLRFNGLPTACLYSNMTTAFDFKSHEEKR